MGVDGRLLELNCGSTTHQAWPISLHAFSDLTHVSPVVFLYLLKECYFRGTCKGTAKFRALQQRVHQSLYNTPQPGPAIFVARCLYILPIFESYCEGFSHLIISALRRFLKIGTTQQDLLDAKQFASKLFIESIEGKLIHDERILIKILEVFDIGLVDIEKAMFGSSTKNDSGVEIAKSFVEQYIFALIESESYMTAVTLLEHFSIRQSGESFLYKMMENKEFRAAEKWAVFMGKPMLCILVQKYIDRNLLKYAYEIIKKNNLRNEFPEVYHKGNESSLKKLAEKGCWEVAEARTDCDRQLLEYLVYLAMEAGYSEKVDELCDRYSLKGFISDRDPEASVLKSHYLQLKELALDDIIWVDEVNGLNDATTHLEGCKVVGIDCEWKPNYEKGSKPNKVSIMQIASEKKAYIFDMIKLNQEVPDILDNCLARILQSPRILKLGYNFQCDVKQLSLSYGDLECFKHYAMLLDIQNVFKEPRGGLSGLAKKILGAGLNKTRRNSNWEQRPLSRNQLEYAALDATVLIHIFWHVRSHSPPATAASDHTKIEWKSQIVSRMDNPNKTKKQNKIKKEDDDTGTDEPLQSK